MHSSPSGKYSLNITQNPTKPGCWNYSTGEVSKDNVVLATVNRNYSCFPFLFIENHPNGHDYLICGEDYQGQTVIELDTGKRRDFLPDEAKDGIGFCWAGYEFDIPSQVLIVDGCYWACPYEYRFFDFSDPMKGWPELVLDEYVLYGEKKPEIQGDIFKTYEIYEDDETNETETSSIKTFKREGDKLLFQEEWVSDAEKVRREENEKARVKYEAEMKLFKETDPLYLLYRDLLKDMPKADTHASVGITYEGWCPGFESREQRWCHRIHDRIKEETGYTIDLEWATKTGPIQLIIFKNGNSHEKKVFEHSVKGMQEAFDYAKGLINE